MMVATAVPRKFWRYAPPSTSRAAALGRGRPAAAAGAGDGAGSAEGDAGAGRRAAYATCGVASMGLPHTPQNLSVVGTAALQRGHGRVLAATPLAGAATVAVAAVAGAAVVAGAVVVVVVVVL